MKIKSMIASIAACAIAVSALAVGASAAITNPNDKDQMTYAINETDTNWANIQGVKVTVTAAAGWEESGFGGGVIFQGKDHDWNSGSREFNISGEGTPDPAKDKLNSTKTGDATFVLTYDNGSAIFADIKDADDAWAQCIIQSWWGADFTVDDVSYIYADGSGGDATPATTADPNGNSTTTTTTTAKAGNAAATTAAGATKTGDAGVGVAVGALGLAAVAAAVARKKH